jgi:tetratricopeptide (TPR) repeat protein
MRIYLAMIFLMIMGMLRFVTAQDLHATDSIENVVMMLPAGTDKVDRMLKLCDDLIAIKDFKRAEQYLGNACSLSETLGYQRGIAGFYAGSGYLLQKQGDYDQALVFLDRAMKLDSALGENTAMVLVYNRVALIHRFRGEYPEAISNYEAGISLAEQIGDTAQAYQTSLNLWIIYKLQGNNEKALEIFLGALPFYELSDNLLILTPLDNCIGTIFYHQKEYDEALKHLNSALDASRALGLEMDVAINLLFIGLVYRELGQFQEALYYEFQALQIYSEKGSKNDLGRINTDIGDTYSASGNPGSAVICTMMSDRDCQKSF